MALAGDRALALALATAGQKRVREMFDPATNTRAILDFYERLAPKEKS